MEILKRLLSISLVICVMFINLPRIKANAADYKTYTAQITSAPNGADSIISMTFDDGLYDTAVFLNKMFKIYNLKGSAMMLPANISSNTNLIKSWQTLFSDGYLEAQNHSATHMVLPSDSWAKANDGKYLENNTAENYQKELIDSKTTLTALFDNDIVAFAPSNNTLSYDAYEIVRKNYYAVRSGSRGLQSLDPTVGTLTEGSWHNLKMRGLYDGKSSDSEKNKQRLIGYVDEAAQNKGWLVTMCHSITKTSGDATESEAEAMFRRISYYQNRGQMVSMTFGDAVKYIRERQMSTVNEYENENGLFVEINMEKNTADSLVLDEKIFNYPLTVKAQVPSDWSAVSYICAGENITAPVFTQDGNAYAYINVVPNSGSVLLSSAVISNAENEKAEVDVLYVNGEVVSDFNKNITNLSIPLEPNSTYPSIEAVSFNESTVVTQKKITFPGSTLITAKNGDTTKTYNINFYIEEGIYDFNAPHAGSELSKIELGSFYLWYLSGQSWALLSNSNTSSMFDKQIIINRSKNHAGANTLSQPWYAGAYSGKNGEPYYYSFKSSLDCTVYFVNVENALWQNRPDDWKDAPNDVKIFSKTGQRLVYKEFKANEQINLPNFGVSDTWTDTTKRYESNPGFFVVVLKENKDLVSSDVLTIKNGLIHGYENKTIGEIKSLLNLSEGCTVSFFDSSDLSGSEADDNLYASNSFYAKVTDDQNNETYLSFGTASYRLGEIKTSCTNTSKKLSFKKGTLTASVSLENYTKNLPLTIIAAQYDNSGKLINFACADKISTDTEDEISVDLNITETENTTVKIMLFNDTDSVSPYLNSVTLKPIVK